MNNINNLLIAAAQQEIWKYKLSSIGTTSNLFNGTYWMDFSSVYPGQYASSVYFSMDCKYIGLAYGTTPIRYYLSTDYGKSFNRVLSSYSRPGSCSCYISRYGNLIAFYSGAGMPGRIWVSTDYGNNWNEVMPTGDVNNYWNSFATSDDLKYQLCSCGGNSSSYVYYSNDYGASFSPIIVATNTYGGPNKISSDGKYMYLARTFNSGKAYITSDYGANWNLVYPYGSATVSWNYGIGASKDGKYLLASFGHTTPNLKLSTDYGNNWTQVVPSGNSSHPYFGSFVSVTGKYMFAHNTANGCGYISEDYGVTWNLLYTAGSTIYIGTQELGCY